MIWGRCAVRLWRCQRWLAEQSCCFISLQKREAFKAWQDFSDKFFRENKENELTKLLNKIPDGDLENDKEDYSYTYEE